VLGAITASRGHHHCAGDDERAACVNGRRGRVAEADAVDEMRDQKKDCATMRSRKRRNDVMRGMALEFRSNVNSVII
jgi:hypothetical protein